ncbi:MAG: hypothetical protein ABIS86_21670 [Streptosporangiaceae bacterium]
MPVRIFARRTPVAVPHGKLKGMMSGAQHGAWHMMSRSQHGVRNAAGHLKPSAGRARDLAGVRILDARGWTAPQFDRAAHFMDSSVAPRISTVLTGTARLIEPTPPRHRLRNTALGALGTITVLALVGAVAMRRRNQMADLLEPDPGGSFGERGQDSSHHGEQRTFGVGSTSPQTRVGRGSGTGHSRGVGSD